METGPLETGNRPLEVLKIPGWKKALVWIKVAALDPNMTIPGTVSIYNTVDFRNQHEKSRITI